MQDTNSRAPRNRRADRTRIDTQAPPQAPPPAYPRAGGYPQGYAPVYEHKKPPRAPLEGKGRVLIITAIAFALVVIGVLIFTLSRPAPAPEQDALAKEVSVGSLPQGVSIALPSGAPRGYSLSSDITTAQAPATVVFTLKTGATTQAARLMRDGSRPLAGETRAAMQGDGMTFEITVTFTKPYTGDISAMLRGSDGNWVESGLSVSVDIR